MPNFILIVALMSTGPGQLATDSRAFNDREDCHQAALLAMKLLPGPMKAICIDVKTGQKVAEASRG